MPKASFSIAKIEPNNSDSAAVDRGGTLSGWGKSDLKILAEKWQQAAIHFQRKNLPNIYCTVVYEDQ
jgi:hypothetical protein